MKQGDNLRKNSTVVLKDIPTSFTENNVFLHLRNKYISKNSVTRFIKDGKALTLMKVVFNNIDDAASCLRDGL